MTEGRSSGEENANLYTPGSTTPAWGRFSMVERYWRSWTFSARTACGLTSSDTWKASSTSWKTTRAHSPKNNDELLP